MQGDGATKSTEAGLERHLDRLGLADKEDEWAERYLMCEQVVDPNLARPRQRFEAVSQFVRDLLVHRWIKTRQVREQQNPKRVYYLSMEFLIGRTLNNNIANLRADPIVQEALRRQKLDYHQLAELEPDAGLGNGGLGRLAACFIDSLATLQYSAMGYGLRYEYGIFKQAIQNGYQVERAGQLVTPPIPGRLPGPERPPACPSTPPSKWSAAAWNSSPINRVTSSAPLTIGRWSAMAASASTPYGCGPRPLPDNFDFADFFFRRFRGGRAGQCGRRIADAGSVSRRFHPGRGHPLRFLQEYFLVLLFAPRTSRLVSQVRQPDFKHLPDKVAIQLNDTHPAMAVAELMHILLDQAYLDWESAWDLTVRTLAYTNHTLLPEALERWPVELFELLLPRHLQIIYEINDRFLLRGAQALSGR